MKRRLSITLLMALLGVALGSGLHHGMHARHAVHQEGAARARSSPHAVPAAEAPALLLPGPRPDLEEVLQAGRDEAPALMLRYLREASIDEVIALLEEMRGDQSDLNALSWMAYRRGLSVDPQRVVAWVGRQENNRYQMQQVFRYWAALDPRAALAASADQPDEIRQSTISVIAATAGDDAMDLLAKEAPDSAALVRLRQWKLEILAEESPSKALEEATALPDLTERKNAVASVIRAWANKDPLAALHWVESQDEFAKDYRLLEPIIAKLAETDPVLARSKLENLPSSRVRGQLEEKVVATSEQERSRWRPSLDTQPTQIP